MFKPGDKVYYIPFDTSGTENYENGIVKDIVPERSDVLFVVFNFNNDPDNYRNYTGQLTVVTKLRKGWCIK